MYRHSDCKFDMRGARNRSLGARSIGLALGVLLSLTASVVIAAGESSTPREIVVGVPAYFPPYFQLDTNNRPIGFAIDVTEAVAIRAGLKVRYKVWEHARDNQAALRAGTVDVLPSLGISKRRLQDFSFTAPIETFQISLFVRKDSIDIDGLDNLGQRLVGAVVPNLAHRILSQRDNINLKTYNDAPAALFALLSAQIDAFAYPAPVAWKFAREAGISERIKIVGEPIAEIKRAMAVRKGNTELLAILDPAVREFVASEEYRRIYTTWFGAPAVYWTASRILWPTAVVVVMLLIAMAWWRYHSLVNLNRGLRESIFERERAEKALRESEERFRSVVNNSPTKIHIKDAEGRYLLINSEAEKLFGVTDEGARGKTSFDIFPQEQADAFVTHDQAVLQSGETIEQEEEWLQEDGVRTFLTVKFPIRDGSGRVVAVGAIGTDITERKRAERLFMEQKKLLQAVVDAVPAIVTVKDRDLRFLMVNQRQAEELGCTPEEAIGKHRDAFPRQGTSLEEDQRYTGVQTDREQEVLKTGEARLFYEESFTYENGEVEHRLVNKIPLHDADGQIYAILTVAMDITERKQAEDQLRQSQRMEAVGQLTAGVAHDFNNLLAVISGNAEMLEDDFGKDNPQLAAVFRAAERGANLNQRLLAFSRKQMLRPEIVNVDRLIADTTGLLRRTLEENIDIESVAAVGLWNCEVDPAQLENALVNLALNARDAMPDGGKLTIEAANIRLDDDYAAAQADVKPGQYVMLAVTDTGTGMPAQVREHAFEPFFTTKAVGAGSGLGLSMVYGFVKQSGGHVTIYSEQDEGTTIKLYLPRSMEAVASERVPVRAEVPLARGETVLVVEDDPEVRMLAAALLKNLGYSIIEVATGVAGLEQLESAPEVDLLLTDVVLPGGMNGRVLATEVVQRNPGIKVLYMSGYTENAIAHHGRLDSDAVLLQKPFRRADLAQAVRRVLDG